MNPAKVTVTVVGNDIDPREYTFGESARCVIGRAEDCDIQFLRRPEHAKVSRHHCVLDIDPPTVTVRDLGSRNGTYVNGETIGQRATAHPTDTTDSETNPALALKDGDEIQVGDVVLRVGIAEPADSPERLAHPWSLPFFLP
jgi:pSer/pThr/pTyr-binding forkhead associated (FHA) protein